MNGMPVAFGIALKSASDACGKRSTLCPLTTISNAMFPTDGRIETDVSVVRSVSLTISPSRTAL
jgi:hypothetical protein